MTQRVVSKHQLIEFENHLLEEEKSEVTIAKYVRDVNLFIDYVKDKEISKELVLSYKKHLQEKGYAIRSINSMIASLNSYFSFLGWDEYKLRTFRYQKKTYSSSDKELTKKEYFELLKASEKQIQLNLILQTICSTGIRISELKYFTVEAVKAGEISVLCKCKTRTILIPNLLRKRLLKHAESREIKSGYIFVTKNGSPLDRSNVWKQMKRLCEKANVNAEKVYPHNLRKLFARTFYSMEKDIAKLADLLGHGSINTTRIYIMSTGQEHRRKIERLGLRQ